MIKYTINFIALLGMSYTLIGCTKNQNKESRGNQENMQSVVPKMKIEIFNDVDKTKKTLSNNGIGELKNWRGDELGFMSITDYFDIGTNKNGIANNIAYYLESDNEKYIKSAKILLNINNKSQTEQAISKFKEVSDLTFKSLFLETPNGLLDSILQQKDFNSENDKFSTKLILDKTKIDTWKLIIESK